MNATDTVQIESLDRLCKRRRRFKPEAAQNLTLIPSEWRELLIRWVKRGGNSRWETLLKDAGTTNLVLAQTLLEWLVREGWANVTEERKHGDWWPQSLELRNLPQLRTALGLGDKDQDALRWQTLQAQLRTQCSESLVPALIALDELPVHRALVRCDLIFALERWKEAQRSGTRRDFALEARDDTKGISESEWTWLEQTVDLAEFRIERHTPLLLISAPLTLMLPNGRFDLAACSDFAALTPTTVHAIHSISGAVSCWQLIENRTSFERVARSRTPDIGVIWLPGYPPGWWCKAVARLMDLSPAPAQIACDPDPAGIAIALKAAELWLERKFVWLPWKMSASDLAALRVRKPLTEADRLQLASMDKSTALPDALAGLAAWMLEHGEKGEQEGFI
ncbi:MAG: hypothetical protein NTY60_03415 [Proteobacteria bacterium]|nr:hypothetical protein [Pseudomonadota bacterium]